MSNKSKLFLSVCFSIMTAVMLLTPACEQEKNASKKMVCCEIYGYGAKMKKCCQKYIWIPENKCKVPKNFTGGGRKIVSDSLCKKQTPGSEPEDKKGQSQ